MTRKHTRQVFELYLWRAAVSRVILLTGPAAAGKSTIARGLQAAFAARGDLWLLMQLDFFARAIPRDWIAWPRRRGVRGDQGFKYEAVDNSIVLTLGVDGRRVLSAFHGAVAGAAASGVPVICETIIYDEQDWSDWSQALEQTRALWVWLSAPLQILEARERADDTRIFQGLARGMLARPRAGIFDLEADTSAEPADPIVSRIISLR